jgi:hypothetical protein
MGIRAVHTDYLQFWCMCHEAKSKQRPVSRGAVTSRNDKSRICIVSSCIMFFRAYQLRSSVPAISERPLMYWCSHNNDPRGSNPYRLVEWENLPRSPGCKLYRIWRDLRQRVDIKYECSSWSRDVDQHRVSRSIPSWPEILHAKARLVPDM